MDSFAQGDGLVHVGMDTSKLTIAVAVLRPGVEKPVTDVIANDEAAVRQFFTRLGEPARLRSCYEAGPTGFGLYRLLRSMRVSCIVAAPSLIPKAPGDRVKTDKRDSIRLARLLQVGQLTAIHVPTPQEEAVRDLCRTRADLVDDRTRTEHRLSKFLLRHSRVWHDTQWTVKHREWLTRQHFEEPALRAAFAHYKAMLAARDAELEAITAELKHWQTNGPFADAVARLAAYRGIAHIGALTIASEVGDWRRFCTARTFMGFTGLVPSEYSSGASVHRGHITKAGNAHLRTQLIESAWAYQHRPSLGATLRRRQKGVDPATAARAWTAQQRLCGRFRRLSIRKHSPGVVTVAVARELAGFVWAEMTAA
jgi:transposase